MKIEAILLPGSVRPGEITYAGLVETLGDDVAARVKELEVYTTDQPPSGYGIGVEVDAAVRVADRAGIDQFHLVGYSAGGAIAAAVVSRYPDRVLSLALLEPSWVGNRGLSDTERDIWEELERIAELPPDEMMAAFAPIQLAPGVEPPAPPPGPAPPWMAQRPAGIAAFISAVRSFDIDPATLASYTRPVYYALGELSSPGFYGAMARRLRDVFADYTVEVFAGRHHFDPPHRVEPERVARSLRALWQRASPEATGAKGP